MNSPISLSEVLPAANERRLQLFAILCLGVTDAMASGAVNATDSVELFFNAANGLFVRKQLADATADEVMSRGSQLADLFETLPAQQAGQEFQRELQAMRTLCRQLLAHDQLVVSPSHRD